MKHLDWYSVDNIEKFDSPILLVYKDRMKGNIRALKESINDISKLRPHVKTHKTSEIVRLMMDEGIMKFKCATIAEAEMLGANLVPDVLLAYQPIGPKIHKFIFLIEKYKSTTFSCLIDNLETAKALSETSIIKSIKLNVYIDINIGMNRTGILPGTSSIILFKECLKLEGIRVIGLHAYDGHIIDVDIEKRKTKCEAAFSNLIKTKNLLNKMNNGNLKMVVGGSPTFPIHAKRRNVECSPGTFVFWDKGYRTILPEQHFDYAAVLATRIISLPNDTTICIDLGYKAIASEMPLENRAIFLNAPDVTIKSHSEEHMTLNVPHNHSYRIGDVLYAVPHHICPTVALYDEMAIVMENRVEDFWNIIARRRV